MVQFHLQSHQDHFHHRHHRPNLQSDQVVRGLNRHRHRNRLGAYLVNHHHHCPQALQW